MQGPRSPFSGVEVSGRGLPVIGWREWVGLPALGIPAIKAKIDTGARSSALHAYDLHYFRRSGSAMVRFLVHPIQGSEHATIPCEAPLVEHRWIRSSGGHRSYRPVIHTLVELLGEQWVIEMGLTNRDSMGFRLLLGRQALAARCIVDPGRSLLTGLREPPDSPGLTRGKDGY